MSRNEIDVVVTRALRGMTEGPLSQQVKALVAGMFAEEEHSTDDITSNNR